MGQVQFALTVCLRQGAMRKSFDRRTKIAAKHPVIRLLAEPVEVAGEQAPKNHAIKKPLIFRGFL
jgi:hypothetical protein